MARANYDHLFKLLLIGDSGVGKTSILFRFSDDNFNETFVATIGIDFKIRTVTIEGKTVKLQIWDTAGQERFRTITVAYYRGAHGIMLVYDVTNRRSFESITQWITNIKQHANHDVEKMLLGNKSDLNDERQVTQDEGNKLGEENSMVFIETSAKSSDNVELAFLNLAKAILVKKEAEVSDENKRQNEVIDPAKKTKKHKKMCSII